LSDLKDEKPPEGGSVKTIFVLTVFAAAVLIGWAIHPALGVLIAFFGYGAIDGVLSK
jgi:hypothetical protein